MWLVLCHAGDATGAWCAVALRRSGLEDVQVVLAEELVVGSSLTLQVEDGVVTSRIDLRDGRRLVDDQIEGVVNRLLALPPGPDAPDHDRGYVRAERTAAAISWLAGLRCPVLNRPMAHSLTGRWLRPAEWQILAAHVGLPTVGWTSTGATTEGPRRRALVVGDAVVWQDADDAAPDAGLVLDRSLVRLASAAQVSFVEVVLQDLAAGPAVEDATPLPDIRAYGDDGARALARHLVRSAA